MSLLITLPSNDFKRPKPCYNISIDAKYNYNLQILLAILIVICGNIYYNKLNDMQIAIG